MNKITYAGKNTAVKYSKNFEIIVGEASNEITVIPPLIKCDIKGGSGYRITLEQAVLPFKKITVFCDDNNRGMLKAAKEAANYFSSELPKRELILSALGELTAAYAAAFAEKREFSPVVNTVLEEIKKRVSDSRFSLDDFIKKLPLNYDYIRKLFQKETGATPREYLLHERMKLAKNIISGELYNRYSEYTISQIAEACGFSNPLYFSRVFKNQFGVAPSEYK